MQPVVFWHLHHNTLILLHGLSLLSCTIFADPCTGATISPTLPLQTDPNPVAQDCDLDWGDFFFNLVSMCIVYAHFSEAAVAGESNAAVIFSMGIAAVDIVLLALRWLWYEHFVSYG